MRVTILITDIRRGIEQEEYNLLFWFKNFDFKTFLILTKIDKLPRSKWEQKKKEIIKQINPLKLEPILFSAITKEGKKNIWQKINKNLNL